jgi:glycosyltransferase involved in cell wall biosynthesis
MTIRVLHVVTSMNRGGLEVWLMHVLRTVDRSQFALDFLVQTDQPALFDAEILERGARIIRCPRASSPIAFTRAYLAALKQNGPYDVVHTHLHHFSGVVALLSRLAGVRVVVAHSHNAAYGDRRRLPTAKRWYLKFTEWLIRRYASFGIGCSEPAGQDLYQNDWTDRERHAVVYCGLDFGGFAQAQPEPTFPVTLGDRKLIVHVGRFTVQQNHEFLIDVVAELRKRRDDFVVLLVGTGALKPAIASKVEQLRLQDCVAFAGDRNDVDRILLRADAFLFPSLFEGLALALLEAQAAGLRCVISDTITQEAIAIPGAIQSLPLSSGAAAWADALDTTLSLPAPDRAAALSDMERSPFSIRASVNALESLYRKLLAANTPRVSP